VTRPYAIGLTGLSLLIILIGTVFAPWFSAASSAASAILR